MTLDTSFVEQENNSSAQLELYLDSELFVSMTDPRGIILACNDVFCRVSEFPRDRLINSPHNIVRHPDMPRSVFKLLWDTIQNGQALSAYVKNRTKDGRFYWVFATAMPSKKGYLSVRIKPKTKLLKTIEGLYKQVLEHEKNSGLQAGIQLIQDTVVELGFSNYREFMTEALVQEANDLFQSIPSATGEAFHLDRTESLFEESLVELLTLSRNIADRFRGSYQLVKDLKDIRSVFQKNSQTIFNACDRLENLSMNMGVAAQKLGKDGHSLSVVAHEFQRAANDVKSRINTFRESVNQIAMKIVEAKYWVAVLAIQLEMLNFYLKESAEAYSKGDPAEKASRKRRVAVEYEWLVEAVKSSFDSVIQSQRRTIEDLDSFLRVSKGLKGVVTGLDLIRLGGRLEGARSRKGEQGFKQFTDAMLRFIESVGEPIGEINGVLMEYLQVFEKTQKEMAQSSIRVSQLELIKIRMNAEKPQETSPAA